jgi:hypothetical protein
MEGFILASLQKRSSNIRFSYKLEASPDRVKPLLSERNADLIGVARHRMGGFAVDPHPEPGGIVGAGAGHPASAAA